jgi:hypothetical protein
LAVSVRDYESHSRVLESNGNDDEGVKQLVVPEGGREQVGLAAGVDQGPERVEDAAGENEGGGGCACSVEDLREDEDADPAERGADDCG